MEDEVTKHTKKIYNVAKNPKYTLGEKVKEIIIEIFIIVFAVTISIWFHNWSDKRHEQNEVQEFLLGLKNDLNQDIHLLENNRSIISLLDSNFNYLLLEKNNRTANSNEDSLINKRMYFSLRVTRPNIGRYEGFKSSGKIGDIENDSLKEEILVFYEQTIPGLVYGEDYVNVLQTKILDLEIDRDNKKSLKDFVLSDKMQSLFYLGVHNFEVNINGYNEAIQQARKIISEIDNRVKK